MGVEYPCPSLKGGNPSAQGIALGLKTASSAEAPQGRYYLIRGKSGLIVPALERFRFALLGRADAQVDHQYEAYAPYQGL